MGQGDSATDGDLDVAFALLLADKQWPNSGYLEKAKAVIGDVLAGDINSTTHQPTLGDWATPDDPMYPATRPSDFMLDHFRAFGTATGNASWKQTVDSVYTLVDLMQQKFSPKTGLLPDFVVNTQAMPQPAPSKYLEKETDGEYFYNSCRVPMRLGSDYLVSGDARAKTAVNKITTWAMKETNSDPWAFQSGYKLSGAKGTLQGGPSEAFISPLGVAAMVGSDQQWLDKIWSGMTISQGYYGDSLTLLSMIMMSGNWWSP
jgi:endo-1,4-beta-D-glucanase Y